MVSHSRLPRVAMVLALGLTACASSSITQSGSISSYDQMIDVKTTRTKARIYADAASLATAKTVRIAPVSYGPGAGDRVSAEQRALIANLVSRELCVKLSDRFDIAADPGPADLTVRAVITRMTPTNREAAAVTVPIRAAGLIFGVPTPGRLPIGMGSFAAEGEAIDPQGDRRAAMVWARGADAVTNSARLSKIGDAYELSDAFAGDMAALVVTGANPLHDIPKDLFAKRRRPVSAASEVYGKGGGLGGFVGGIVGAPPEWTDGRRTAPVPAPGASPSP